MLHPPPPFSIPLFFFFLHVKTDIPRPHCFLTNYTFCPTIPLKIAATCLKIVSGRRDLRVRLGLYIIQRYKCSLCCHNLIMHNSHVLRCTQPRIRKTSTMNGNMLLCSLKTTRSNSHRSRQVEILSFWKNTGRATLCTSLSATVRRSSPRWLLTRQLSLDILQRNIDQCLFVFFFSCFGHQPVVPRHLHPPRRNQHHDWI